MLHSTSTVNNFYSCSTYWVLDKKPTISQTTKQVYSTYDTLLDSMLCQQSLHSGWPVLHSDCLCGEIDTDLWISSPPHPLVWWVRLGARSEALTRSQLDLFLGSRRLECLLYDTYQVIPSNSRGMGVGLALGQG